MRRLFAWVLCSTALLGASILMPKYRRHNLFMARCLYELRDVAPAITKDEWGAVVDQLVAFGG
jgi:hypothetical protein